MAATERVVVLMTRKQKEAVAKRAAAEHLSVAEYMRRQALGDDELLTALLNELQESAARATAALDRTLASIDESERRRPKLEADARRRAQEEFSQWPKDALQRLAECFAAVPVEARR